MFYIFLTNFGYRLDPEFNNMNSAIDYAKTRGFEFSIFNSNDELVAFWTMFSGLKLIG